ncbi:hypothetical protein BH11MYX1_BH11MYX1_51030 [soil metagenome]
MPKVPRAHEGARIGMCDWRACRANTRRSQRSTTKRDERVTVPVQTMAFVIHANLDQPALWAAIPLSKSMRLHLSRLAVLLAALAPDGSEVEVFAPMQVPPGTTLAGFEPPVMRSGRPPHADLVWADPAAKRYNDRRFGLAVARAGGFALPGTLVIGNLGELENHLAAVGADTGSGSWVCKAPWPTTDDCCHGRDLPDEEQRARLVKLLTHHRALVFEPRLARIADFGLSARVDVTGGLTALPPHRRLPSAQSGFDGIKLGDRDLAAPEYDQLMIAAEYAAGALHRAGYAGPFGIDAFAYDDAGTRRFHPLSELDVRYTFGHIAHELGTRHGIESLVFDRPTERGTTIVTSAYAHTPIAWVTHAG